MIQYAPLLLLVAPAGIVPAQDGYRLPPQAVVDIVDAAPPPSVDLSPDGSWMLLLERDAMPSMAELARPMLRLAGVRIDPAANARYQTSFWKGLAVRPARAAASEEAVRIPLPEGARVSTASWSHDSRRFYYALATDEGSELWVGDVENPASPRRISERLSTVTSGPVWSPDGNRLLVFEVPPDRGSTPEDDTAPKGPNVRETSGNTTPLRTYQDLLQNPHDEALFEHFATAQPVLFDLEGSDSRPLGEPAIYSGVDFSPDGNHLLVTRIEKPWSYVMPYYRFPMSIEVWDPAGKVEHTVAKVALQESIPIQGVRTGPRNVDWKAGEDATLYWVEALDEGDPRNEVEHRDRWLRQAAPFEGDPTELLRTQERAWGLTFLEDPGKVIATEYDRDRRWLRSLLYDFSAEGDPVVLEDRSVRDRYGDPGRLVSHYDERGKSVVRQDGDWVYRTGSGASPKGLLPFLDRQNLATLETERLWRCEEGSYESVAEVLAADESGDVAFITRHESPASPANYRVRGRDEVTPITQFSDPTPQIRGIKKELITYEREDGVPLSGTLYLPEDYEEGTRLPLVVWAYPIEFNDPQTAGQVGSSPWRFTRISGPSHLALVTQGYAVLDGATMPVIGDPETMNDTFVDQIVMAADAAIQKVADMGVADPERVAVGGHSYGAFMTANLLAHSDLFRTGIARSGAYNRTLTPFGFQSERRTIWEAPEAYFAVSPFFHAHKIDEPILLIHGEIDNNSGTFPMQSERLFQAIKGNGGTAKLVMLPNESHGYRARESVLHVLAESIDWLDQHVKNASPVTEAAHQK